MTETALINARVLTPEGFKDNQTIVFHEGTIGLVCDDGDCPSGVEIERDLEGMTLVPGFIDTQVNGGGGILFNDCPTVEGIAAIGKAHRKYGTTGFLPTLITDDLDIVQKAIDAVEQAIEQGIPGVLGIHLEGPCLNQQKRGVHDASKIKALDLDDAADLCRLKGGKTLITLAPEKASPEFIQVLVQRGIIVSAGHTMATFEQTLAALDTGLTGFTHLFNAMAPLESRNPGVIAAALQDPRAWCGIIVDGHHVHPAMLRMALRAKVRDQMFLVTDAMPSVGNDGKAFRLGGLDIEVAGGKCLTQDGTLAGSDLNMITAVTNAVDFLDVDLAQAIRMASLLPAKFIDIADQVGEIRAGLRADFILLFFWAQTMRFWRPGSKARPPPNLREVLGSGDSV